MEFKTVLFYAFFVIAVFGAMGVITVRNPVNAALFLVLSFFSSAAVWMLLKAEFLAIALVLVYVGAVMVLFLFVVMMLDINLTKLRAGFWSHLKVAAPVGVLIMLEMAFILIRTYLTRESNIPVVAEPVSNTRALGRVIFTDYVFAFEVAAAILLVAIVAAVALTLRRRKDVKGQVPSRQVAVRRSDRIRLVSMAAEKKD